MKWLLLRKCKNVDTTFLHLHDDISFPVVDLIEIANDWLPCSKFLLTSFYNHLALSLFHLSMSVTLKTDTPCRSSITISLHEDSSLAMKKSAPAGRQ